MNYLQTYIQIDRITERKKDKMSGELPALLMRMSILSSFSINLCAHSRTDFREAKSSFSTSTFAPVSSLNGKVLYMITITTTILYMITITTTINITKLILIVLIFNYLSINKFYFPKKIVFKKIFFIL